MSVSTLHPVQPQGYNAGLSHGVAMSDAETLRFANGIIAAINSETLRGCRTAKSARLCLEGLLDLLAEQDMIATVGYAGTPIVRPLVATNEMAAA
jgi:hypothetical protein